MQVYQFLAAFAFTFVASLSQAQLQTVPYVDPAQYLGTWYQISHNPLPFEDGCVCSRQLLGSRTDDLISVYNSCNEKTPTGVLRGIAGTASNVDPSTNAKFLVDFGFPRKGDYWIIGLDPQYRFAVVSDPSLRSLYILSKTPALSPDLYAEAVAIAAQQVDTSKLEMTLQSGCAYPSTQPPATRLIPVLPPSDAAHPGSPIYDPNISVKKKI